MILSSPRYRTAYSGPDQRWKYHPRPNLPERAASQTVPLIVNLQGSTKNLGNDFFRVAECFDSIVSVISAAG